MNDFPMLQASSRSLFRSLSMGVKLIIVCGLALLMAIPAFFVSGLVDDRTKRAEDVVREISSHVGGPQTFLGPTLAIPYSIPAQPPVDSTKHGIYFVFRHRLPLLSKPQQKRGIGHSSGCRCFRRT